MTQRQPAVAGFFYPGARDSLLREVDSYLKANGDLVDAKMVVVPHAGYVYSGPTAGTTLARVNVPGKVILLGPKHRRSGARGAVSMADEWSFPFGNVPVDRELADLIIDHTDLESDDLAHREEHSLEVQVPFLWRRNPDLALTPVALGVHDLEELKTIGEGIARAISELDEPVLIVASTDMSHQIPIDEAKRMDHMAIDKILALNPSGLYDTVFANDISMCGVIPTTAALFAANACGASRATLVRYTTSADATGDTSSVVGYAGIIVE